MTLGCHLAAPTPVKTSAGWLVVSRLTLADYGLLLQGAGDARGLSDDDSPDWGDPETVGWLTGDGVPLFLWVVLRRERPGLTVEGAEAIAEVLSVEEKTSVFHAAMRRASHRPTGGGGGLDIARGDWADLLHFFLKHKDTLPGAVGDLTPDQLNAILSGDDGKAARSAQGQAELMAMWEERQRVKRAAGTGAPRTVEGDLAALGLRIADEAGDLSTICGQNRGGEREGGCDE